MWQQTYSLFLLFVKPIRKLGYYTYFGQLLFHYLFRNRLLVMSRSWKTVSWLTWTTLAISTTVTSSNTLCGGHVMFCINCTLTGLHVSLIHLFAVAIFDCQSLGNCISLLVNCFSVCNCCINVLLVVSALVLRLVLIPIGGQQSAD